MPDATLTDVELARYSRHLLIPEFGRRGQEALKRGRALIVGVGGLGSPASLYLAAAGVGTIGLVDQDRVDATNLQRQVLYSTADVGHPKLERARQRLEGINPGVNVRLHEGALTSANALQVIADYDVVIDATDNFPTRYLINDACVLLEKPDVYGSIYQFEGQASVFWAPRGPCYRCLFAAPPPPGLVPSCAEGGVLGVLPGVIGSLQANEAIKILAGIGAPLVGRLLVYDALGLDFMTVNLKKDQDCAVCGRQPTVTKLIDYEDFCGLTKPGRDGDMKEDGIEIDATQVKRMLDASQDFVLLDVRNPPEAEICRIEGDRLIPMNEVPQRLAELPKDKAIVVYCRTGSRSMNVTRYLRAQGYALAQNLRGGIHAWIDEVDPSLPKY